MYKFVFHKHRRGVELNCAASLVRGHLKDRENEYVSSKLNASLCVTLNGELVCNVAEVSGDLEKEIWQVVQEVDAWVHEEIMEWVEDEMIYKLVPPSLDAPEVKKENVD